VQWHTEMPDPNVMLSVRLQDHYSVQKHHHARWLTATCRTESLDVDLCKGTSFICQYHLIAEALGCQCKWYLGRSPLLFRSTMMNSSTIGFAQNLQFHSIADASSATFLLSIHPCLAKGQGTSSVRKRLVRKHMVQK